MQRNYIIKLKSRDKKINLSDMIRVRGSATYALQESGFRLYPHEDSDSELSLWWQVSMAELEMHSFMSRHCDVIDIHYPI